MKVSQKNLLMASVLLGALLVSAPAPGASPYDDVLVQKATQDLQQENYDEALAELTGLGKGEPYAPKRPRSWVRSTVSCSIIPRPGNTWKSLCA